DWLPAVDNLTVDVNLRDIVARESRAARIAERQSTRDDHKQPSDEQERRRGHSRVPSAHRDKLTGPRNVDRAQLHVMSDRRSHRWRGRRSLDSRKLRACITHPLREKEWARRRRAPLAAPRFGCGGLDRDPEILSRGEPILRYARQGAHSDIRED